LPYRLIQLYIFKKEVVLDPFVGSGTTCIAALKTKRYHDGIFQPSIPLPAVFTRIAALLKDYYDGKSTKELHSDLPSGTVNNANSGSNRILSNCQAWFLEFLGEVLNVLESPQLPAPSPKCKWCNYINIIQNI